jgi:hypothetical protein
MAHSRMLFIWSPAHQPPPSHSTLAGALAAMSELTGAVDALADQLPA